MAEHRYPERTVAPPPGQPITVGLRVPRELPAGAAGLRDYAARAEAAGIDGAAEIRALLRSEPR